MSDNATNFGDAMFIMYTMFTSYLHIFWLLKIHNYNRLTKEDELIERKNKWGIGGWDCTGEWGGGGPSKQKAGIEKLQNQKHKGYWDHTNNLMQGISFIPHRIWQKGNSLRECAWILC